MHHLTIYSHSSKPYIALRSVGLLIVFALSSLAVHAQKTFVPDTTNKINIQIINADNLFGSKGADSVNITRLIGNVHLLQGGSDMTCDSAYFNIGANNVEAFGNVHISQPGGTNLFSDYLRYTGDKKQAFLKGNVKLDDGKSSLYSEELTYNLGTKTAVYNNGGTLQSANTTVSSNKGTYNVNTKDARFTEEVIVTDPDYNTTSDDLGYNTGTEVVTFYGPSPSTVINDKSTLVTRGGTYDTKNEIARFTKRTSITSKEQFVEGDRIDYNRNTGFGNATGNVIAIDTLQHTTQWSGYASYNEKTRILISAIKPVLRQMNGKDSLFIRADTFYSVPYKIKKEKSSNGAVTDTSRRKKDRKAERREKEQAVTADSRMPETKKGKTPPVEVSDTTSPRYYIGYHHVLIWSDSLQGRCDSIAHSEKDSVMKMMGNPVAWSRRSQVTGDTIMMYLDSNKIKRIFIPNNALVVSLAGPDDAGLYDQIQGKTLTGYFKNNTIREMVVWPDAQSIYYSKDDSGAYLGVNESQSERMRVFFKEEQIQTIRFEQQVTQKMTPLDQADLPNMQLSRFKWLEDKRPKSREELFK